ncbi:acyl-CoA thioesterase [Rhodosalinus sp.]|uniref:acyl-CoA thioesterase n=1 Tax=Rhodosalinus sp. TaxID=2047741 RepID=UPI0035649BD5
MRDQPEVQSSPEAEDVFEHEIAVRWGDCDPAEIAYTGNIPGWALAAIDAWWEARVDGLGWYQMNADRNLGTPFVSMQLDFRAPITPRHRLICRTWPSRLGETSIAFRVDGYQDGRLCFEGRFVSVFVRADAFHKAPPPEDIRTRIEGCLRPDDAR